MNAIRIFLLLGFNAVFTLPAGADDRITAIDVASAIITVDKNGTPKVFKVKQFTEVSLNGTSTQLDQLKPGMTVKATLDSNQTALKLAASGVGIANSPAAGAKPKPFYERGQAGDPTRRIFIKMVFDGVNRFHYRDGQLWIEHLKVAKPSKISVNGVDWVPVWKGETSEPFTAFDPPLAPVGQARVTLNQMVGRNKAKLERSNSSNIVSFYLEDNQSGPDTYEIVLNW